MKVVFPAIDKELELEPGTLISDACELAGAPLDLVCAGNGTCGKCLVDIEVDGVRSAVLGCQHRVERDMLVFADASEKAHQLLVTESAESTDFNPRIRKASIERSALKAPLGGYDFECLEQAVLHQIGIQVEPLAYDLLGKLSALLHKSESPRIAAIVDGARIVDLREDDGNTRLLGMAVDIYTGCTLITGIYGIDPNAIEEVCLAGAFGNYIDIPCAQLIGLLPSIPGVPIRSMGNGAGLGAQHYLLSTETRERAETIRRNTTHIELASDPNFTEVYMRGMAFERYAML